MAGGTGWIQMLCNVQEWENSLGLGTSRAHVLRVEENIREWWDIRNGLQSLIHVHGVMSGSFHHQHLTLVLQDLRCVCGLEGEAKIDSWRKVLDLGSSLLNRVLCFPSDTPAAASHRGILAEVLSVCRREHRIDLLSRSMTECSLSLQPGRVQFC